MNLSDLSLTELQSLENKIAQEIKKRQKEKIAKAREQIMSIAQSTGLPLKDLINAPTRGKGLKVAVQYRHPSDTSLQWTGRGHQPVWVREWIASGKTLDALRV
jgi:DNA-binding protein H-NS